jgi:hypothetical protein
VDCQTLDTIGAYIRLNEISRPGFARRLGWLRDKIGLNLIVTVIPYHSVTPDAVLSESRAQLKQMTGLCSSFNIDVWPCVVTFSERFEEPILQDLIAKDVVGNIIPPQNSFGFKWMYSGCPTNQKLRDLAKKTINLLAKNFSIQGITVTHNRYSPLSHNLMNLFGCTCSSCKREAEKLGYDFERMKGSLELFLERLKHLDKHDFALILDSSPMDALYNFGLNRGLLDWLRFRCDVISVNMRDLHSAAKSGNSSIKFGTDVFPPSFSLLVGHSYKDIEKEVDFVSPLLSHPYIFTLLSFAVPTRQLLEWNNDLPEGSVLSAAYSFAGYKSLNFPLTTKRLIRSVISPGDFNGKVATDILDLECRKATSCLSSKTLKYAYVSAQREISPHGVARRLKSLKDSGTNGVIFQFGRFFSNYERNVEMIRKIV